MIEIRTSGEALDLPQDFSIEIEDSSPIFNDRGSQSVPATVPATRRNIRLLDAPHRIDAAVDPNLPERKADVIEGAYIRRGVMNITEAGKTDGITFNIGFDNSTAYATWQAMKLNELTNLPTWEPDEDQQGYAIDLVLDEMYRLYRYADPQKDDFAVFPIAVNNESTTVDDDEVVYWEVFNAPGSRGMEQQTSVNRLIDNTVTAVTVPEGYCVSPFLRVWRVLELVFDNLGYQLISNPFKENLELSRLVVLNNTADAVCLGKVKYSDVMPDCTVEEFLNALWVRFGLVYNINCSTGEVTLKLLKDILAQRNYTNIDSWITGSEKITYEERQYIKLSAQTSIEGASPSNERFEDFIQGLDVTNVHLGLHVSQWTNVGTQDDPQWDGDVRDDYYDYDDDDRDIDDSQDDDRDQDQDQDRDQDDQEDQDDGRDDDQDDGRDDYDYDYDSGYYAAPSRASSSSDDSDTDSSSNGSFLAREFITGMWYRLDATNGTVRLSSSSFFSWDPQPDGLTALELASDDECVPIDRVDNVDTGTGNSFNGKCPVYLFGARHYHSYIKGSEGTDNDGDETPLAFMFAYTKDQETIGRINSEGDDGKPMTLDDGTTPALSLLFQFKDGLFANFWTEYDEILRHGNRYVEINARINKLDLYRLDIMEILRLKGIRCLLDTSTYSLPAGKEVSVDLKLRPIQTQGTYDIVTEQNIPDFAASTRHLEWRLKSDGYTAEELDTSLTKAAAAKQFIQEYDYQEHGEQGDYYYVGTRSCRLSSVSRAALTWENDTTLPTASASGQTCIRSYKAILVYDVYEIHDMSTNDDEDDWELDELPLGQVAYEVEYSVTLTSKWVAD